MSIEVGVAMRTKTLWVFGAFWILAGSAFGQSSSSGNNEQGAAIEIKKSPVSEIPAQYRADAPKPRKPFAVRFTCPDSGRLYVVFDNAEHTASIEMGQTTRYLRQVPSADGGRYTNSDESYVFWVKGKQGTINGKEVCEAD